MVEEPREIYEAINHKKAFEIVFENVKNTKFNDGLYI